jgi:hypothetical protein
MRRAARIDDNQKEIVQALRAVGASVAVTSALGDGFGDIVIGFRGQNFIIEIKDENKPPSKRKLTPAEEEFHNGWNGQIDVAINVDEALSIIGAL